MNNEIGRKITSLTLMTIMIAGGLTFAVPGVMPAAHAANANLFVSAENSQFDNYMSGPQVIEVVIIDSDINDTNEGKGEPDVTVNGKILRMVQATDGNWYGYFADRNMALIADSTSVADSQIGLDFGEFCTAASGIGSVGVDLSDTVGFAIPFNGNGEEGNAAGGLIDAACTNAGTPTMTDSADGKETHDGLNVVREPKAVNQDDGASGIGQIGIDADYWPFVQLYTLNPTGNVVVQYNKGGGVQTTTLTFDTADQFAELVLDRSIYPQGAQVHATITDLWLNIDPTDEDSWTFGTFGTASTNYQVFDENGAAVGDDDHNTAAGTGSLTDTLSDLMCGDSCILITTPDAQDKGDVITLQDNDDSEIEADGSAQDPATWKTAAGNLDGFIPVTFTEQGPNSGVFGSYDEGDVSNIVITDDADRGTSATIDYNESAVTILVGFDFATIDIQPTDDEWSSGEEIPVVLVDGDANKNSRVDEDLVLFNPDVELIPSLSTGNPFTITDTDNFYFIDDFDVGAGGSGDTPTDIATAQVVNSFETLGTEFADYSVDTFSQRAILNIEDGAEEDIDLDSTGDATGNAERGSVFVINYIDRTLGDLKETVRLPSTVDGIDADSDFVGFNYLNLDVRSFNENTLSVADGGDGSVIEEIDAFLVVDGDGNAITADELTDDILTECIITIAEDVGLQSLSLIVDDFYEGIYDDEGACGALDDDDSIALMLLLDDLDTGFINMGTERQAVVADFFSFGFSDDGVQSAERVADQIIRIESEETGDNTSIFEGSLEYVMVNQLNISVEGTYGGLSTIADDPGFIVIEDLTDEDSPRVNYDDLGADGVVTPVSDQEEAPSHSGIVSLDSDSYKIADTVTITLEDADLNVDSSLIDIFTVVTGVGDEDPDNDVVGFDAPLELETLSFGSLGRMLDVTFDDQKWQRIAGCEADDNDGLGETGFTLVETGPETGVFVGDFQIPSDWCREGASDPETSTGLDIEVNYVDFRDASGEIIEVGDSAGVRANTGSISLDRTVYPVPFGTPADFGDPGTTAPDGKSIFAIHATGFNDDTLVTGDGTFIPSGDLMVHIRVNDPDSDTNAQGENEIAFERSDSDDGRGPVKVSVIRGVDTAVLGFVGGPAADVGKIFAGVPETEAEIDSVREFGPMDEIAPDAGIFEFDLQVRYTDGPADTICPETVNYTQLGAAGAGALNRFNGDAAADDDFCILQGDILQVEYEDPADASGDINTVTDSATFDLRNGVLQSDKSVYIIGSDMILTLIEPDFDLDNDAAETYDLDLIEWDSDAATVSMGDQHGEGFDPEPTDFRETGDSTGIFQVVVEIPEMLDNDPLERGEEATLEYTDWGPSGADYVGQEDEDVNLTIYTSNFGATVELDQKVYTWTDKVYITIVAPDHNFDSDLIDEIGRDASDPIKIATRGHDIDRYKLVETGTDTGIFTGEVILVGFAHDADGVEGDEKGAQETSNDGVGPTDGFLETDDDDGLTVSFEFSDDETVVGSALIRWNIGEVQWLEASYPASGTGVVRVIDPDMNLDPEAVDNFNVDVWSDSDAGGIDLTVTETNEATGIFEGTVFFTTLDESSGHRLRVAEGDTVTAEYEDNTLPDPYTTADELDITATSLIGTVVPPLERAPAANLRTVDAFGNSLDAVAIDQQVQISADLANGQDREQSFAYLVQIQDANGVTVSLAWITGSLSPGQSFSPALSWIPTEAGTYTATAFVWESVDNPTALSPPVSTTINVS
ncbi:MAG: hypothetical protein IS860_09060 [Nitrosopumilus sp.]|nr:hypothetical protein [Nitrosopumilus sp.]